MIKAIMFDLDGTLLPMEQSEFVKAYFGSLAKRLIPLGFEAEKLYESIWAGIKACVKNTSDKNNETIWWDTFISYFGDMAEKAKQVLDDYYENDFKKVQASCGYNPKAKETVDALKARGYRLVLATNPIFPKTATRQRIGWAGIDYREFELVTSYENCCRCKPNIEYYKNILDAIGCRGEECMMIGNDVDEDMVAEQLGMKVFLLTDSLLNKNGKDISVYRKGSFGELMEYISELEAEN